MYPKNNLIMANSISVNEQKQRRDSLTMSIVIHGLLLLLLLLPILTSLQDDPEPPKFQGIQVAFGQVEAKQQTRENPAPSSSKKASKTVPVQSKAKPSPVSESNSKPSPTKLVSKTLTKKEDVIAVKEKVRASKKESEEKAKMKAKAEAKAKAIREAEEKAKKAEEEKARKAAEEAAKKEAAKSKFNNILKSADGKGAPSKGSPNGHPDAEALEGITKGRGKAGNGLGNRGLIHAPVISDNSQSTGRVVVNICVNAQGKVMKANFTQKGSTTTDSHLIDLAIKSAKNYRFSESNAVEQCGDITIDFKLR